MVHCTLTDITIPYTSNNLQIRNKLSQEAKTKLSDIIEAFNSAVSLQGKLINDTLID